MTEASALHRLRDWPRERLAARVTAASYGTILVLTSLAAIEPDAVESGWGWELVTAVGLATWVAHLYSEIVGDHLLDEEAHGGGSEVARAASDGAPIPPEIERHLFEPFFSSRSRGTGLGLYICRELCERYGAGIEYQLRPASSRHRNAFWVTMRRSALPATEHRLHL